MPRTTAATNKTPPAAFQNAYEEASRRADEWMAKFKSLDEAYQGALTKHADERAEWAAKMNQRIDEHDNEMVELKTELRLTRRLLLDAVAAASGRRNTN